MFPMFCTQHSSHSSLSCWFSAWGLPITAKTHPIKELNKPNPQAPTIPINQNLLANGSGDSVDEHKHRETPIYLPSYPKQEKNGGAPAGI